MINVLYDPFPDSIKADGKLYQVQTDFRKWLRFSDMNADKNVPEYEKSTALLMMLKQRPLPVPTEALILELFSFYRADALNYHPEQDKEDEEAEPEEPFQAGCGLRDRRFPAILSDRPEICGFHALVGISDLVFCSAQGEPLSGAHCLPFGRPVTNPE